METSGTLAVAIFPQYLSPILFEEAGDKYWNFPQYLVCIYIKGCRKRDNFLILSIGLLLLGRSRFALRPRVPQLALTLVNMNNILEVEKMVHYLHDFV